MCHQFSCRHNISIFKMFFLFQSEEMQHMFYSARYNPWNDSEKTISPGKTWEHIQRIESSDANLRLMTASVNTINIVQNSFVKQVYRSLSHHSHFRILVKYGWWSYGAQKQRCRLMNTVVQCHYYKATIYDVEYTRRLLSCKKRPHIIYRMWSLWDFQIMGAIFYRNAKNERKIEMPVLVSLHCCEVELPRKDNCGVTHWQMLWEQSVRVLALTHRGKAVINSNIVKNNVSGGSHFLRDKPFSEYIFAGYRVWWSAMTTCGLTVVVVQYCYMSNYMLTGHTSVGIHVYTSLKKSSLFYQNAKHAILALFHV